METKLRRETASGGSRSLAEVETDLLEAESVYADADARMKAARSERTAAIESINRHQRELDSLIAELRQRSVPGTRWRSELASDAELLELGRENMVSEDQDETEGRSSLASRETNENVSRKFAKLNGKTQSENDDPVLQVVFGHED